MKDNMVKLVKTPRRRGWGSFFGDRVKSDRQPRPLGSGISSGSVLPGDQDALQTWMVWSLEGSAVASTFWGLCLYAPDTAWSQAVGLYAERVEDILDHDGSMSFDRFAQLAADESETGRDATALRFLKLAVDPLWGQWLAGSVGRQATGSAMMLSTPPKLVEFYQRALSAGWSGALELAPLAQGALGSWMERSQKEGAGMAHSMSGWESKAIELGRTLAFSGVLSAPDGYGMSEKAMARAIGHQVGAQSLASFWSEMLLEGESSCLGLSSYFKRPEPKLLVDALSEAKSFMSPRQEPAEKQKDELNDAQAILLAQKLGWIAPKHVARALKRSQKSDLSAMAALLESQALVTVSPEASAPLAPRPRL
jgi:hypothetical protein